MDGCSANISTSTQALEGERTRRGLNVGLLSPGQLYESLLDRGGAVDAADLGLPAWHVQDPGTAAPRQGSRPSLKQALREASGILHFQSLPGHLGWTGTGMVAGEVAEGEGFEPPLDFRPKRFSRPPVSTTHTSLRGGLWGFGFIVTGPAGSGRAACGESASGLPRAVTPSARGFARIASRMLRSRPMERGSMKHGRCRGKPEEF